MVSSPSGLGSHDESMAGVRLGKFFRNGKPFELNWKRWAPRISLTRILRLSSATARSWARATQRCKKNRLKTLECKALQVQQSPKSDAWAWRDRHPARAGRDEARRPGIRPRMRQHCGAFVFRSCPHHRRWIATTLKIVDCTRRRSCCRSNDDDHADWVRGLPASFRLAIAGGPQTIQARSTPTNAGLNSQL
jgi:hypothetical protein